MYGNLWYPGKSHRVIKHKYSQANSECTRWHFAFPLCCHSNDTRVPITNQPNSTQLGSTPIPFPKVTSRSMQQCGNAARDRQTHRRTWPIYISRRLRLTRNVMRTRMWADAQRDGRPAKYRWRPLRQFRNSIPCTAKFGWGPLLECRALTLPIQENARLGRKVNFARSKIPSGGESPQKSMYSVKAQETAKDRAKFGWPPVSDVAAVIKPRRETG